MINSRQQLHKSPSSSSEKHNWDALQDLNFSFCYLRSYNHNQGQSRDLVVHNVAGGYRRRCCLPKRVAENQVWCCQHD